MFWDAKRKHLREAMDSGQSSHGHPPQRQRRKSSRESLGSENEERNNGGRAPRNRSLRDSTSDDSATEGAKQKRHSRPRKSSESLPVQAAT